MNILVFGGSGFLGSNFVKRINLKQNNLFNVSHNRKLNIEDIEEISLNDAERIRDIGFDIVINFASKIPVDDATSYPFDFVSESMKVNNDVMKMCRNITFKRFLYISTDRTIKKDKSLDTYGFSKKISYELFNYLCKTRNINMEVAFFPNIYGPNDESTRLIPTILRKVSSGEMIIKLFSFQGGRNYLHLDDASEAIEKITQLTKQQNKNYYFSGEYIETIRIINLVKASVKKFYNKDIEFLEKKDNIRTSFSEPPQKLDDQDTRRLLNWAPKQDFNESIENIIRNKYEELQSN